MAVGSERGSASRARTRGRTPTNVSSASAGSSRARASSARSAKQASRSTAQRARSAPKAAATTSAPSGSGHNHSLRDRIAGIGVPVVTATIGAAGGVLLGRTALQRNRKLLGVTLPTKIDLTGVSQQIGEAGRQFGRLASEVRTVREKAEKVGRAIT
jgi:hypothetical protein